MVKWGISILLIMLLLNLAVTSLGNVSNSDYRAFYFIHQWLPSYCNQKGTKCCYPPTGRPAADFTIYGLWPYNDGGNSLQNCPGSSYDVAPVTFVSKESVPPEFSRSLKYGNATYHLYSNSLLHFGQNVAFDSLKELLVSTGIKLATESSDKELIMDPCTPKGYAQATKSFNFSPDSVAKKYSSTFHAIGNFSECRATALKLLHRGKDDCSYHHCSLGATFMPKLHGRFLATENFFHTSQFFGLAPEAVLSDVLNAGQQFCEDDWSNIRKKYASLEEENILHYCFSSAYIVALLHDSLGVALDDRRIGYTNKVDNISLDWALGAFILQTTEANNGATHGWIASLISDIFSNVFLITGGFILLIFAACYISQWRKPYFKTIYDLEKGRYIKTRINR